jgi:hypothetical protein
LGVVVHRTTMSVRAHEEKYRAELAVMSLERRIIDRYAGVAALEVARIEQIAPFVVRGIRARHGRGVDDGHVAEPGWREQLSFEDLDRMMRGNRSARA